MSYRLAPPVSLPALLLAFVLALCASPAGARDRDRDQDRDQDRARNALLQGEIRPLSAVLKAVREKVPGEIIEIELDREDKGWVYEVKVLTSNGRRKKVDVDAHSLDILKID